LASSINRQRDTFLLTSDRARRIVFPLGGREDAWQKRNCCRELLDLLILKILTLGPNHGWGISNRIRQISREGLNASQGSPYPALHRLDMRGDVESEMTASENDRKARVYRLTPAGRRRLEEETATRARFALSIKRILQAG